MSSEASTQSSLDEYALCLACSASIPPSIIRRHNRKQNPTEQALFFTNCCKRPICPSCIVTNARLKQYDPCLHCFAGIGVINRANDTPEAASIAGDQDVFVVGDDDGDQDMVPEQEKMPLSYRATTQSEVETTAVEIINKDLDELRAGESAPSVYYLGPEDTLQGIALKHDINGHELCRLNNLPSSTLTTTPQLVHTRAFVLLPPSRMTRARNSPNHDAQVSIR